MLRTFRRAKVNTRLLITLAALLVFVVGGIATLRHFRKRSHAADALAAGTAAYEAGDWEAAARGLRDYLQRLPRDTTDDRHLEIPEMYASALLRVRPLTAENVNAAITTLRRVIRMSPERLSAYRALAEIYIDLRNLTELKYVARKIEEISPGNPKASIWLATALIGERKLVEAQQSLEQTAAQLESGTLSPEAGEDYVLVCTMLSALADQAAETPDAPRALHWLDRALERVPDAVSARLLRARLHLAQAGLSASAASAERDAARADIEAAEAAAKDPKDVVSVCRAWAELGELNRALEVLDGVSRADERTLRDAFKSLIDWKNTEFLLRADLLLRLARPEEAVARVEAILSDFKHPELRLGILPHAVRIHVAAGALDAARASLGEYRTLVAARSDAADFSERAAGLAARIFAAEGRPYDVIATLEPFAAGSPRDPDVYRVLADAYDLTRQKRRAIAALRSYVDRVGRRTDPRILVDMVRAAYARGAWTEARLLTDLLPAGSGLATYLRLEGRFRELDAMRPRPEPQMRALLATLNEAVTSAPDVIELRLLQAATAFGAGDPAHAERLLREAWERAPENLAAPVTLLRMLVQLERFDDAASLCAEMRTRCPQQTVGWVAASEIAEQQGDRDRAAAILNEGAQVLENPADRTQLELRLAMIEFRADRRDAAIERLENLAASQPKEAGIRSVLLQLPEVRSDPARRAALLDELRKIEGPSGLQWRFHEAVLWLDQENWSQRSGEIRERLEECRQADPGWSAPVVALGQLLRKLGEGPAAEAVYRSALGTGESDAEVVEALLGLLREQGRYDEALNLIASLRSGVQVAADTRIRLLLESGRRAEAIRELEQKISADAGDFRSRLALARLVQEHSGDTARALDLVEQAAAAGADEGSVVFTRANLLRDAERPDEALAEIDAYFARDPTFSSCLMRAAFLAQYGTPEQAADAYAKLPEVAPSARSWSIYGEYFALRDRMDEALSAWQRGLESFPADAELRRKTAMGLLSRKDPESNARAAALLDALEREHPDDADVLWIRTILLLADGTPENEARAEQLLERIVTVTPSAVRAHLARVELALARGNLSMARDRATVGLAANPSDPSLLVAQARIERASGDLEGARKYLRLVLRSNPADTNALELFVRTALDQGRPAALQEARAFLESALADQPEQHAFRGALVAVLDGLGNTAEADSELARLAGALEPDPLVGVLLRAAEQDMRRADAEAAEKRLAAAAAIAADDPRVLELRARWLGMRRDFAAVAALVAGERSDEKFTPGVRFAAGDALVASPDATDRRLGATLLAEVTQRVPAGSEMWYAAVGGIYQAGAADAALALLQNYVAQYPRDPRGLNDLAWILAESAGRFEEALAHVEQGLRVDPEHRNLLDTRAFILTRMPGRMADARRDYEKCVALSTEGTPARARALLKLARVTRAMNDALATQRALRDAQEIDRSLNIFSEEERREIETMRAESR